MSDIQVAAIDGKIVMSVDEFKAINRQIRADERKKIMEILDSADDEESAMYVLAQYLIAETVKEQWNE